MDPGPDARALRENPEPPAPRRPAPPTPPSTTTTTSKTSGGRHRPQQVLPDSRRGRGPRLAEIESPSPNASAERHFFPFVMTVSALGAGACSAAKRSLPLPDAAAPDSFSTSPMEKGWPGRRQPRSGTILRQEIPPPRFFVASHLRTDILGLQALGRMSESCRAVPLGGRTMSLRPLAAPRRLHSCWRVSRCRRRPSAR